MNSQEIKKEIENIEVEMKNLLSETTFRQVMERLNFLNGAKNMAAHILSVVEEKEKAEVEKAKAEVKEDVDKALT